MVNSIEENDSHYDILQPPELSRLDIVHSAIKGILSAGPAIIGTSVGVDPVAGGIIGAYVAEFFGLLVTPPIQRRIIEWIQEIAFRVVELENKKSICIQDLIKDEVFITTLLQATQIALRNHTTEKREALRNIVLNAAMPHPPDEDLQLIFIYNLDSMTPWHIRLLHFLENPIEWWNIKGISREKAVGDTLSSIIEEIELAFPELKEREDFLEMIVKDLQSRDLIYNVVIRSRTVGTAVLSPKTTEMGHQFVQFITSPIELGPLPKIE